MNEETQTVMGKVIAIKQDLIGATLPSRSTLMTKSKSVRWKHTGHGISNAYRDREFKDGSFAIPNLPLSNYFLKRVGQVIVS